MESETKRHPVAVNSDAFQLTEQNPAKIEPFDLTRIPGWNNGKVSCFSNGVVRGTRAELEALRNEYNKPKAKIQDVGLSDIFEMSLGDFFCYNDNNLYLMDVIKKHPSLKLIGFMEDWFYAEVWVVYSASGYDFITDGLCVGCFDLDSELPWQWEYSPTEKFSDSWHDIRTSEKVITTYRFPFEKKWEDTEYYVCDGKKTYRLDIADQANSALPFDSPKLWSLKRNPCFLGQAYIKEYLGQEKEIFFPETIGDLKIVGLADRKAQVPKNYKNIEVIHLPDCYTHIGKNAFRGCNALTEVIFPHMLYKIDDFAFADCCALESITLPSFHRYGTEPEPVGHGVFKNCIALKDVYLKNAWNVRLSSEDTFEGCPKYVLHSLPNVDMAKDNLGHCVPASAEDYLHVSGETSWPVRITLCARDEYRNLPFPGEWLEYSDNSLHRSNGHLMKLDMDIFSTLPYAPLFSFRFVQEEYGYSDILCWFDIYPKTHPHAASVAGKRMDYKSPRELSFKGKLFVLDNQVQYEVEDRILERGGEIKASVSQKIDYLITNPKIREDTPKRLKAREINAKGKANIKIISLVEFFKLIGK